MVQKRAMYAYPIVLVLLIAGMVILAEATENVTFKGSGTNAAGSPLMLAGKLTKPPGNGPFPALVLMHGSAGIVKYNDDWADRLASWGYLALQVDSFGPRGVSDIIGNPFRIPVHIRAQDAYDARAYLGGLPFVDPNRIAVMGWSHGGNTALSLVSISNYALWTGGNLPPKQEDSFRAAIPFYPYCQGLLEDSNAPLLIMVGNKDTWCPASLCQSTIPSGKATHEIILKIYPGAYHGFDWEGIDVVRLGQHRVLYNPEATADSIVQVREFLGKHLR